MIERFVLQGLGVLRGAAVRGTVVKWNTFGSQRSVHEDSHAGKKCGVMMSYS